MMDTYQAVYDAVRSRIQGADVGHAVEEALSKWDISWPIEIVKQEFLNAAMQHQRPSVVMRPKFYIDGDMWCALYGENLQNGVAGFGHSPHEAANDFDKQWETKIEQKEKPIYD